MRSAEFSSVQPTLPTPTPTPTPTPRTKFATGEGRRWYRNRSAITHDPIRPSYGDESDNDNLFFNAAPTAPTSMKRKSSESVQQKLPRPDTQRIAGGISNPRCAMQSKIPDLYIHERRESQEGKYEVRIWARGRQVYIPSGLAVTWEAGA
ncbi:hypothetical protein P280DRAFT_275 [Massarina eburnea CBS 473.64]|uniref:Uncharacterized protein n=1 Tax=Massarina eburnea CBS 473.64 TaxID=1395130 RepID=A0A6A6SIH7_9PLEO|nr:hypothetical protein P280DRAFT_275 [Massarina eburnea CBS 473.64]